MSKNSLAFSDDIFSIPEGLSSLDVTCSSGSLTLNESDAFKGSWTIPQSYNAGDRIIKLELLDYPDWLSNTINKLEYIFNLPENWDSYGANQIVETSALVSINLIFQLLTKNIPEPSVVPINNGGIQIEWHMRNIDLEIEVQPTSIVSVYMDDLNNEFEPIEFDFDSDEIRSHVEFASAIDLFVEKIGQR